MSASVPDAAFMGAVTERTALPDAGSSDLRAAADALRTRLPEPLSALADIAYNYRWSWTPGGPELFAEIDPERWELTLGNPVRQLQEAHPDRLEELAADERFLERVDALERAVRPRARRRSRPPASRRRTRSPSSAPSTRSTARCRSTPAASACWPATSSRSPPTAPCR